MADRRRQNLRRKYYRDNQVSLGSGLASIFELVEIGLEIGDKVLKLVHGDYNAMLRVSSDPAGTCEFHLMQAPGTVTPTAAHMLSGLYTII